MVRPTTRGFYPRVIRAVAGSARPGSGSVPGFGFRVRSGGRVLVPGGFQVGSGFSSLYPLRSRSSEIETIGRPRFRADLAGVPVEQVVAIPVGIVRGGW